MSWKVVNQIYVGTLGKALLIIALATPMSFLVKVGVYPASFVISLVGALLILTGYIWTSTSVPPIIKQYADGHDYAIKLSVLNKSIDWISEFKVLEDHKSKIKDGYDGHFHSQFNFTNIDNAKNELGDQISLRSLSILKFNLINDFNKGQRIILTILFILGSVLIYMPLIHRIFIVLGIIP